MKRNVPFVLVHGFELALALALTVVALVFTAFPEALSHVPVGFENRGIIHHVFHYALLTGALLSLIGLVGENARAEMMGLILLAGAISINLIALVTGGDPEGIAIAFRSAALIGVLSRLYLIAFYLPHLVRKARTAAEAK